MLEKHLNQLVEDLELPPLPPKEKDTYKLSLNSDINFLVKELDPGFYLFSKIGLCPTLKREELFIFLMKANFLGQGTGGGAIAMDGEEKFLTLSLAIPYDVNYKGFKEKLEDFANYVDYWKEELVRHQKAAEESIHS